jgi:hypothetical protein
VKAKRIQSPLSLLIFHSLKLEGLERILQRQNFVVFYESHPTGMQLKQIWIASNRKATQPPPPQEGEKKTLNSLEVEKAAGEQQELSTSPGRGEIQRAIETAVSASDPLTRTNAVRYLGTQGQNNAQARATLEEIARSDADIQVQKAATEALQRRE